LRGISKLSYSIEKEKRREEKSKIDRQRKWRKKGDNNPSGQSA
jgi:hypothetical protein